MKNNDTNNICMDMERLANTLLGKSSWRNATTLNRTRKILELDVLHIGDIFISPEMDEDQRPDEYYKLCEINGLLYFVECDENGNISDEVLEKHENGEVFSINDYGLNFKLDMYLNSLALKLYKKA